MTFLPLILTVTGVHLLAAMTPGPDFIVAVKNSLSYSRKTGIWTSFGFALGISVHIFYCLAGLAVLISQSILVFNILKFLGAAYLIFLGTQALLSKSSKITIQSEKQKKDISAFQAIKIGFLTNVLNPKATLFFLSLFTIVLPSDTPFTILLFISAIMILNQFLWFSLVALFFTQKRVQCVFGKFQNLFQRVFGGFLFLLGIRVAIAER
jgi:RhtB (resistance to homoserine/threonine) family protein